MTDGSRHALVVAGSRYEDPKLRQLRSPATDAERLAGVLGDPAIGDFAVESAIDESEGALRRRIAAFLANRRSDDLLLLHFSCHGVQDEGGELHLAARDTEIELLGATSIAASWLSEQIARSRSKRIVLLLDCCFSGSFPFGLRARAGETIAVTPHLDGRGRVVITASSAMEYSWEGDHLSAEPSPSVFTQAVLEGLETGAADRDGDDWVSVDELYDYVCDRVHERAPYQRPQKKSDVDGAILLARTPAVPPAPSVPRTPPRTQTATSTRPAPRPAATLAPERIAATSDLAQPRVVFRWPQRRDRVLATLVDGPLVLLAGLLPALAVALPLDALASSTAAGLVFYVTVLPLGGAGYLTLLAAFHRDRTLGQQLRSLRVVAPDGGEASLRRRSLREALKWAVPIASLFTLGLLGRLAWRHVKRRRRPFYDRVAGTSLVQAELLAAELPPAQRM
ncbi:MAG: RDD family protein [Actinobacteria bacterium]|nr:RDD family protein [Actinomycetota bacterium]